MNRSALRREVARRSSVPPAECSRGIEALVGALRAALARGDTFTVRGLGRLETVARGGRRSARLRPSRGKSTRGFDPTPTERGVPMDPKGNSDEHESDQDAPRGGQGAEPLGLDVGTSRIVLARGAGGGAQVERELNAFVSVPYSKFTENILKQNKVAYHVNGGKELLVFGTEAEKFAEFFNTEMRRPMRNGVLNANEPNGVRVIESIIQQVLPKTRRGETLCFSVPGAGQDVQSDLVYHEAMLRNFLTDQGYKAKGINEGLAVIFAELESENFTGIGISCGGGMCNVCLAFMSVPVFSYSISRAGDYIDSSVASVTGEQSTRIRLIKEVELDLSKAAKNKYENALSIYYDEVVLALVESLSAHFKNEANVPRLDRGVPVVLSGGTASPKGFVDRFKKALERADIPLKISGVRLASDPLTATARGCAVAALYEE
jgi:nucleoid DNA-binding protein